MRKENRSIIGSGLGSTVSEVGLEGNLELLSDKRAIEAEGKARSGE